MLRPGENVVPLSSHGRSTAESFREEHRRELLTILFTDLADSTQLQSDLGNLEAAVLTESHRHLVRETLAQFDAREIEWAGDSCLAVFAKPSDGVAFALRLQASLRRARTSEPRTPHVRIGIHVGEIVVRHHDDGSKRDDLFGLQVSETARVMSLARADQIYCTRSVFDNARSTLKGGLIEGVGTVAWKNYGLFELQGSEEPAEICEVGEEGFAPLLPPKANEKCAPIKGDIEKWRKRRARRAAPIAFISTWIAATTGVLALLAGVFLGRYTYRPPVDSTANPSDPRAEASTQVTRFTLRLPAGFGARQSFPVAISPDGSTVAFAGDGIRTIGASLFVRRLDQFDDTTTRLPGSEGAFGACFSPDGESLAFTQSEKILRLHLSTGTTEIISAGDSVMVSNSAWGRDGSIVLGGDGLKLISARGESKTIARLDRSRGEVYHSSPAWIPGKNALLYTIWIGDESHSQLAYLSLDSGETKILHTGGSSPRYSPTGHLVFGLSGKIWAVPFDLHRVEVSGKPEVVIEGVAVGNSTSAFHFSSTGTLVYVAGAPAPASRELFWMAQDGTRVPLNLPESRFIFPSISPDGTRLAVSVGPRGSSRLWLYDLERNVGFPLITEPGSGGMPVWSPTGDRVAFRSENGLYYAVPVRGEQAQLIVETQGSAFLSSWSPDGKELVYTQSTAHGLEIMAVQIGDASVVPRTLVQVNGDASLGRVSPDGRWLAYTSNISGRQEIWVQGYPVPGNAKPFLVSTEGGRDSVWSRDGKWLYFLNNEHSTLFKIATQTESSKWGLPEKVCELDPLVYIPALNVPSYDVAPDGRFIFARDLTPQSPLEIRVVLNWFEELKRLVPVKDPS